MSYINRRFSNKIKEILSKDKSILLLGPRQTGKTTFIKKECQFQMYYSLARPRTRLRFEANPDSLVEEVRAEKALNTSNQPFIVAIDEIQKVPALMDAVQFLIDEDKIQFIITGSSARKLKKDPNFNLLPGRVIKMEWSGLSLLEIPPPLPNITDLLVFGSLPEILTLKTPDEKQQLLDSYVSTYLEEEVRQEALVRNLGAFSKFLTLVCTEVGKPINFSRVSQDIGVSRHTLTEYYQILEDCLLINKIEPITNTHSRRRLTKSAKYLLYDLGVRRVASKEGYPLPNSLLGTVFEHFVGLEIQKYIKVLQPSFQLKYWSEHGGAEVDYVIDMNQTYIPIEVKWTDKPKKKETKHLETFLSEYPCSQYGYIICRAPRKMLLSERVLALPWQELPVLTELF